MIDLNTFMLADFETSTVHAAAMLRTLSNERRLMILCQLAEGEMSVGKIGKTVPLSQSALSQHLAVLREQGIVSTRRESQTIYYRIVEPAALRIIALLADIYCPKEEVKA